MSITLAWARFWSANPCWFGGEDDGVLIDLGTGRTFGHYQHDGFGKWDVWLCLPYWRAWWLLRTEAGWFFRFAQFPHCWVQMVRSKSREGAVDAIEATVDKVLITFEHDMDEAVGPDDRV